MAQGFIEKEVVVNAGRTATVDVRVKPLGTIVGSVENVSTDALLKGIRIQLLSDGGRVLGETQTGDDGTYRFTGLASDDYRVKMLLPKGYLAEGDAERAVKLMSGGELRADFQVYRHGSVEGRVTTDDGAPLGDAEVSLVDSTGAVLRTVRTDANGAYTFPDVPVDKYTLRVSVPETLA